MPTGRYLITTITLMALTAAPALSQEVRLASSPDQGAPGQQVKSRSLLARSAQLSIANASLAAALTELRYRSGVLLVFSPSILPADPVTCDCEAVTVGNALDRLLTGTSFGYIELDRQIVIRRVESSPVKDTFSYVAPALHAAGDDLMAVPSFASRVIQQAPIAGQVVDSRSLQPIVGAQVAVVGTDHGTITDANGRFRIEDVPGVRATLQVVMIGYRTLMETVDVGNTGVRLTLVETAIALDEVVVTGTAGAVQKRAIGNTVATIDAAAVMAAAPVKSMTELLTSRAPGVVMYPGSGMAGGGSRIEIRGTSSLTLDTQPLIYVDGIRIDNAVGTGPDIQGGRTTSRLNDINPDDIASIEIIKGPAAATLYGTEAANGVIQIITKKGTPGSEPRVTARVRQGVTWFDDPESRFPTNYWRNPETGELESLNVAGAETAAGRPIFRYGHMQGYGLSVSGGSQDFQYYLSGDLDHDEGVEDPNVARRFSGRGNISAVLHPTLDVRANFGLGIVRSDLVRDDSPTSSVIGATMRATPRLREEKERGFYARPPEVLWQTYDLTQNIDRFTGGLNINHRPVDWFTHRLTAGIDLVHEANTVLVPHLSPELARFYSEQFAKGEKDVNLRNVSNLTVDYSGSVSVPLSDQITSRTSIGFQYFRELAQFYSASGEQFPAPGVKTVGSAAIRLGADDFVENVTVGTFLQEQVAISDRLFVTAAIRADDNSAFGRDFDIVTYPKLSASWVVSDESFWSVPGVDALRLRGAWGASGQQPDAFAALRTFEPVTGIGDAPAATPQSIGNPGLAPERGEEIELGFEAALLQDRIGLDFTYYNQVTNDALVLADIAPSTGFPGQQWVNAGEVRNTGLELLLTARAFESQEFDWDLSLNLGMNEGEIVSLGSRPFIPLGVLRHVPGYPPAAFFLKRVVSADLDENGRAINVLCDGGSESGPLPCDEAPVVYSGQAEPSSQGAITSTLTFSDNLRLHAMLDFQWGQTLWAEDNWVRCSSYRICQVNYQPHLFDPTYVAEVERAGSSMIRSIYMKDASWTKLREISLNYTFPQSWATALRAERASITVAGRNLHMWTDWTGLDPEVSRLSQDHRSLAQAQVPMLAQFVTTLNLSF